MYHELLPVLNLRRTGSDRISDHYLRSFSPFTAYAFTAAFLINKEYWIQYSFYILYLVVNQKTSMSKAAEKSDKNSELGTLIVVLLKARNLNDKHSFRKQDVFAQATLNSEFR